MTNAEKFEEVFGVRPDVESLVLDCPTILRSECQYIDDVDMFCHCEKWWDEEYKEKPMIEIKPPETGDMYLDKFQNVADELCNIIEHSLDDEREQVLIRTSFLKDIDWLLSVGHRAYMNKPNDDIHEISKTLKEILREMRKRKV